MHLLFERRPLSCRSLVVTTPDSVDLILKGGPKNPFTKYFCILSVSPNLNGVALTAILTEQFFSKRYTTFGAALIMSCISSTRSTSISGNKLSALAID